MSEEIIGLVWLHSFSPIDTEVEYCTGRESWERHAEAMKKLGALSRWWPSSQLRPSNQFCRPRAPLVPQHNPKQKGVLTENWICRHCIASRTRFLFHWTPSQPSAANTSHITKSFTEALNPIWTWFLLVLLPSPRIKGYSEHEAQRCSGTDPLLALRSSWGSASASWTYRFFPWQANRSSRSQLANWSCRMPKLQFAQTTATHV